MKNNLLFAIAIFSVSLVSTFSYAQSPSLGTAANFVLFTTVGAVTNTSISQLTGNVGSNSGSSTGFGNVNGVMDDNNGASAQAGTDLLLAYNNINTTIPDFYPAPLLGNGDTLIAGVYHIASVATLSGKLILDAKGNGNAVFIFQIQGAFSTAASSKVRLINGAQACNVFWKVEGLVSMAPATYMSGTVIANNGAINMTTYDTLEGRALSISGAVSVDGVLAYLPSGCGVPLLTGPTFPILGNTVYYALFSADGPVNNVGGTSVQGSVGTNVGLTVGYDSAKVSCSIHPIPDTSTAKCAADLLNLYNYLNAIPYDIQLLYPAQFGNNLVLTPHTYILKGATTFTDSLYLNAMGNSNAVFVIQINGALSTSTFSKVLLINGAKAKNVFWKVDGAVNINDYSVFVGTIICNNGAISIGTGVTLIGSAFTTTGALTTKADSVVRSAPVVCETLPVKWLFVHALANGNNVLLQWATASEINNKYYSVQKSAEGQIFHTIGTQIAAASSMNSRNDYFYTDVNPDLINYYRIVQTDNSGQKTYSAVVAIRMQPVLKVTQYLQENDIMVLVEGASPTNASIILSTTDGRVMSVSKVIINAGSNQYQISKPPMKGVYIITLETMGQRLNSSKIMVY